MNDTERMRLMLADTPWQSSYANETTEWVWGYSPLDPETGVPEQDNRITLLPVFEARLLVLVANERAALLDALREMVPLATAWATASGSASELAQVTAAYELFKKLDKP